MSSPFRTRTYAPVAPGDRPRKERAAVRVIVTDGISVLLFLDSDPGIPGSRWYVTPGGGIDPGETHAQTAVRELEEETGLRVEASALVGPIMERVVLHGYSDQVCVQSESFYMVRTPRFEPDFAGHTPDEQLTLKGHAWIRLDELGSQGVPVWPAGLADLVDAAGRPGRPPMQYGTVEESTLPVDAV